MAEKPKPYHHGDLPRALVGAALETIAQDGPAALSLRDVARRVGVSHAAPAHHFGDRTGLLTTIAAEGFRLLAAATEDAYDRTGSFLEVGVSYVRFAVEHPAHFAVMFRPDLLHADDPDLRDAQARSSAALYGPAGSVAGPGDDARRAAIAGWAMVHGLATLYLGGNLPADMADDPERLTREIASLLFARA